MTAGSLLPVTICDGKLYFLFGKENPMENSSKGFSDFGGGAEDKSLYETALREAAEELTGFFGSPEDLRKLIKKQGGTYIIKHNEGTDREYRVHIFFMEYDPHLVEHFNHNHKYLWNRMDKKMLNESRLFEKIEIKWFCETELLKNTKKYRHFYVDIVKRIVGEKEQIRQFISKCAGKSRTACKKCGQTKKRGVSPRPVRKNTTRKTFRGGQ